MPSPRKPNPPRGQRTPQSQRNASTPRRASTPHPRTSPQSSSAPELIDPRWLLKALAMVLAAALLLAWGTLCLLYYQGQWQLVLHPSRTVATTPTSLGLKYIDLTFDDDVTGQPQLHGWYIPVQLAPTEIDGDRPTALLLHGADGSMSDALPRALTLHNAGLNVLLFDYRGYGRSVGRHPTEDSMQQDAEGALNYLISTQHVPAQSIILYGQSIGASLAAQLATNHHDIPAIILDAPDGDLLDRAAHDPRSRLVPARLLFHETFPLAQPLRTLATPKLLISYASSAPAALADASDPKTTVELPSPNDPTVIPAIRRFVDLYVAHTTH